MGSRRIYSRYSVSTFQPCIWEIHVRLRGTASHSFANLCRRCTLARPNNVISIIRPIFALRWCACVHARCIFSCSAQRRRNFLVEFLCHSNTYHGPRSDDGRGDFPSNFRHHNSLPEGALRVKIFSGNIQIIHLCIKHSLYLLHTALSDRQSQCSRGS